ncbi:hypothetical protein [Bacillus sp. REN16]|uniref:hypothetical protein n=1 Tax=Bacillus sp. REN16 TaxID=2887296 RepID=UPI001E61309F|nr:hypothetical protein [Bacillus sp. REN16]MCC3356750.1 hypothetical protein [Bacillus sp. REN16]
MKRALKNYIWVLVILTLFACSTNDVTGQQKDGVLTPVKQTERNTQIISSLGFDTLLMYDLDIKNKDIKMMHFWIEHYKNGEKQEDIINGLTGTSEKMTLGVSQLDFKLDDTSYTRWTFSSSDGTALTTFDSTPLELNKENVGMAQTWVDDKTIIEAEKPIILALLASDSGNGVRVGLDEEVIEDTIKESSEVIVVKAMISEKDEH